MPKTDENAAKLFRTLEPDDSRAQLAARAAARDAEQRWPLLKAALPKKWDAIPDLTTQETEHRDHQVRPVVRPRKRALSLPGTSDLMLNGLNRMAVQRVATKPRTQVVAPAGAKLPPVPDQGHEVNPGAAETKLAATQTGSAKPTGKSRTQAASQVSAPVLADELSAPSAPVAVAPVVTEKRRSLFSALKGAVAPALNAPPDKAVDKSLGGVFGRLAANKPPEPPQPETKRSPIIKKLGQR